MYDVKIEKGSHIWLIFYFFADNIETIFYHFIYLYTSIFG